MRMQTLILNSALVVAVVALLSVAAESRASACSCIAPSVESSYLGASDVGFVDVQYRYVFGDTRYYLGHVVRTFKGCLAEGQRVILTTSASSASCGVELKLGQYLINGMAAGRFVGTPVLSISLCSYDRLVSELSEHDRAFLEGRMVCCGDACSCGDGSEPVQCFADPCAVAPPCSEGECVANYCGGCQAEFYDSSGAPACQGPIACATDEDCHGDGWCRQAPPQGADEPRFECVPFASEGERCNGFTLPWAHERCEPGLTCDTPDFVADAPGICRRSCEGDGACDAGGYCASDRLCDGDGACERDVDCNLPGNAYAHIACVGYGVCGVQGQCGWQCGPAECVDVSGFDFGACEAVLGWAVVDGHCRQVRGCSAGDFALFASADACRAACEAPSCDDLSGSDFGACKGVLGSGVVDGQCVEIAGCDGAGHALFADVASCQAACLPECVAHEDCKPTGCSGQLCAATDMVTTCEYRPEFACYAEPGVTQCGCFAGQCAWEPTEKLAACLEAARADSP